MLTFPTSFRGGLVVAGIIFALSPALFAGAVAIPNGAVTIQTKFPGGNVHVERNDGESVHVAPDLRGDNAWFYWYFEATATKPGRVRFVLPETVARFKNGGIGLQGPAISNDRGETWRWMGTDNVKENAFHYDFARTGETVRFAVTIPYVQSDLDKFLKANSKNKHLQRSVLTKSRKGRPVALLQVGAPGAGKKAVLMTARHHAVETMASYVLEGILQAACADEPEGEEFRKKHVLYVVPIVDMDGVEDGDQGKNRKPVDYNRDYGAKSIYPEIQAIRDLDKAKDFRFTLDLHCPTLVMADHQVLYFVGAKNHPQFNFDNVSEFARKIKARLPKKAPHGPLNWLKDAEKPAPMNSHYFGFKKGMIMAATLEIPFSPKGKAMDVASCRSYGEAILKAFVETHFVEAGGK